MNLKFIVVGPRTRVLNEMLTPRDSLRALRTVMEGLKLSRDRVVAVIVWGEGDPVSGPVAT